MVRNRVKELHRLAVLTCCGYFLTQGFRNQPAVVHVDVNDLSLVRGEGIERPDISRRLGHNDVAWVAKNARDEIQALLRTTRDSDVVRICDEPLNGHHLADVLAHLRFTLP